jgi:hypothetical protein
MKLTGNIGYDARDLGRQPAVTEKPEGRDTGFRAVSGGPELASGPTLLIEAYALIWILLFGFVLLAWRKLGRIEAKVAELVQTLAASRGKGETQ